MARILLIEDDQPLRKALRLSLLQFGYEVVESGNGREGLVAFQAQPADLVVTDIVMPEVEGIETIRELRRISPKVPIIAISGGGRNGENAYLRMARILGANRILEKPLEIEVLQGAISDRLNPLAV